MSPVHLSEPDLSRHRNGAFTNGRTASDFDRETVVNIPFVIAKMPVARALLGSRSESDTPNIVIEVKNGKIASRAQDNTALAAHQRVGRGHPHARQSVVGQLAAQGASGTSAHSERNAAGADARGLAVGDTLAASLIVVLLAFPLLIAAAAWLPALARTVLLGSVACIWPAWCVLGALFVAGALAERRAVR